jgi:hypothetical protein
MFGGLFRPPPTALVVSPPGSDAREVCEALAEDGWAVATCAGPGAVNCPLLRGGRCDLRRRSDVAVIYVDPNSPGIAGGPVVRLRCAAEGDSPAVLAVENRFTPPDVEPSTGRAIVGALRPPETIVTAVSDLATRCNPDPGF